jgi:hypothetical protein
MNGLISRNPIFKAIEGHWLALAKTMMRWISDRQALPLATEKAATGEGV